MTDFQPPTKKHKTKSTGWEHAEVDEARKKMTCKHCKTELFLNITRFTATHLAKCKPYLATINNQTPTFESTAFYGTCLAETKKIIIILFTKAITSGNIPFAFIENEFLVKAMRLLKIDLPSSSSLRTKWIDTVHNEATVWINDQFRDVIASILANEETLKLLAIDRECSAIVQSAVRAAILDEDFFSQLTCLFGLVKVG